jgi:hypothetical protein
MQQDNTAIQQDDNNDGKQSMLAVQKLRDKLATLEN